MSFFRSVVRFFSSNHPQINNELPGKREQGNLTPDFYANVRTLRSIYTNCSDVIFRDFLVNGNNKATLIYIENLSHFESIDKYILTPLIQEARDLNNLDKNMPVSHVLTIGTFADCVEELLMGNPVVLIESLPAAFSMGIAKSEKRAIEEPSAEGVVRGPREGFIETIGVNIALLRKKIRSPDLKLDMIKIGRLTRTPVAILYMKGIAEDTLIEEVTTRLKRIDIDGVLESGYIEELIDDDPWSIFPQTLSTERPDTAAASLLEGRVVILTDGTPFALIAPMTLFGMLQTAEDYYQRYYISTFTRWLRYTFVLMALLLPSLYVGILTFHQEMIPATLLISIAKSREEVPFPALIEALMMEITFEALREAGIRLPKQIGAAVSIVGALVIGQAAVSAGLVSSPMVMVVAITGIASFMIPHYSLASPIRILRFPIILCAGTLGLLGIILAIIAIAVHLSTLRSFGVPYLTPIAPLVRKDTKDVLVRAPWWMMNKRPFMTGRANATRQAPGQKPGPTRGGD